MKLLLALILLALPLTARKELKWTTAVVESCTHERFNGDGIGAYGVGIPQSFRESIYLDAGDWLYHAVQFVNYNGLLNLRENAVIEVAEDGKKLIVKVGGKQHTLRIEQKSRGRATSSPPSK